MSLSSLPIEITQDISEYLLASDILALATVSRSLYMLFIRSLYRLARYHRTCKSSDLTTGLQEITFWFDRCGNNSVVQWAIIHDQPHTFQQLLLEPRMDLLQVDSYGVTLLHRLSGQGFIKYMEPLIERLQDREIDPFRPDLSLLTPLHYAAGRGMKEAVDLLITMGADASAKDHHGNTPLHLAAVNGRYEVFSILIDAGADVVSQGRFGWTPVDQASIAHHDTAVAELERLGSRAPNWQQRADALNEFVRLSPCPQECYAYHAVF